MAVEFSSSLQLSGGEAEKTASDNRTPTDEHSSIDQGDDSDKKQFVPIKKGGRNKVKSKDSSIVFSTAVELFEKVVKNAQQQSLCLSSRRKISELMSMN